MREIYQTVSTQGFREGIFQFILSCRRMNDEAANEPGSEEDSDDDEDEEEIEDLESRLQGVDLGS